jgi:hypothetical protein
MKKITPIASVSRVSSNTKNQEKATDTKPNMQAWLVSRDKGSRYGKILAKNAPMAAYTMAGMIVAGYAAMTREGTVSKRNNRTLRHDVLRNVMGPSAFSYWRKNGLIDDNGLTPAGQKKLQSRLNGTDRVKTTISLVMQFYIAMTNDRSKYVEFEGTRIPFDSPVSWYDPNVSSSKAAK